MQRHRNSAHFLAASLALAVGCGGESAMPDSGLGRDAPMGILDAPMGILDAPPVSLVDAPLTDAHRVMFDSGVAVDAGRQAEDCSTPGDEDGDRTADCDDADCWSRCAANHVARRHPGLAECGTPVVHTAAQSREACLAWMGVPGDSPTLCTEMFPLVATARFFCNEAGGVSALWLDETLSLPPTESTGMLPGRLEITSFEYTSARDDVRVVQGGGSGPRAPDLSLQDRLDGVRLVTVYRIEPTDVSFFRMLGLQRTTQTLVDIPPRTEATSRATFRTGATSLTSLRPE